MKLYFFPSEHEGKASNPYSQNYKDAIGKYFELVDDSKIPLTLNYPFLHFSFRADVFVLNWIEGVIYSDKGLLKFLIVLISLLVIRLRRKKIIWMLHNIHPHNGENWGSRFLQKYLFKHSSLIIAHSKTAYNYAKHKAECEVAYFAHPVACPYYETKKMDVPSCDVLIWGSILPYKGIPEFISKKRVQESQLRIRIIGLCKDEELSREINKKCNQRISFENRRIDFTELKAVIGKSRYVLFPYIGSSVSSSGALIDTICMDGVSVGPNTGAFKDLAEEGICLTYSNDDEMLDILLSKRTINEDQRQNFIVNNSWQNFAKFISKKITEQDSQLYND